MPIDGRKLLVPVAFSIVVIIASFVFEMLESPAEQTAFTENVDAYNAKKEEIMQLLYDSHDTNVAGGGLMVQLDEIMEGDCVGFNTPEFGDLWSVWNSFLFTITLVTTIGYGTQAPATGSGQMAVVIFSLIGIPVTGMVVTLIATIGLSLFDSCYGKVGVDMGSKSGKKIRFLTAMAVLAVWFMFGTFVFSALEGWSMFDSFYFCFITLTTIGLGDMWVSTAGELFWLMFLSVGLGTLSLGFTMGILFAVHIKHEAELELHHEK